MSQSIASHFLLQMMFKYSYVRQFEPNNKLLQKTYIIVRIDGKNFSKFTEVNEFEKPNDIIGIDAMNSAALHCMKEFLDIKMAYGQSDEYSFLFEPKSNPCNRRTEKLISLMASTFTSKYCSYKDWKYPPVFDARAVVYPQKIQIMDYFKWRQADCHVNNLYNTVFWRIVKSGITKQEATEQLKGTNSSDKNEILFSKFKMNYNNECNIYKKGTTLIRSVLPMSLYPVEQIEKCIYSYNGDIFQDKFWNAVNIE
eukprot:NODE_474_length_8025_cov_0.281983.p2 type:complete len:254 gc:universal NODE_474_length_8025_cov_0.281983:3035-3796(+)